MITRGFGSECIVSSRLCVDRDGYPILSFTPNVVQTAPRVVYRLYVGTIPTGMVVSHHCGNNACLNPGHLYLRSRAETATDSCPRRLTAEDYWYIRRSPLGVRELGRKFDYSFGSIGKVRQHTHGRTERLSLRYALLVILEHVTRKGRRR